MDSEFRYFDKWTEEEDRFIVENFELMGADRLARTLNRTKYSVYGRIETLRRLGKGPERVKPHRPRWHETEELFLINNWPHMNIHQLAEHIPTRGKYAIKMRAAMLGLCKDRNWFEDMEAA